MVFNATFNNISAISWQSVLLVKKTEYPMNTTDLSHVTDKFYDIMFVKIETKRQYKVEQCDTHSINLQSVTGSVSDFSSGAIYWKDVFLYSCCTSARLLHLPDTLLWLYQRSSILLGYIYLFVELAFVYERVSRALIGILFLSCRFSTSNQGQSS